MDEDLAVASSTTIGKLVSTVTRLHSETWGIFGLVDSPEVSQILHIGTKIPELRNYFICAICDTFLSEDALVPKSDCLHAICKGCRAEDLIGICPKEVPCLEFEENRMFFLCWKSYILFCYVMLTKPSFLKSIELAGDQDPSIIGLDFVNILKEGAMTYKMARIAEMNSSGVSSPEIKDDSTAGSSDDLDEEPEYQVGLNAFGPLVTYGRNHEPVDSIYEQEDSTQGHDFTKDEPEPDVKQEPDEFIAKPRFSPFRTYGIKKEPRNSRTQDFRQELSPEGEILLTSNQSNVGATPVAPPIPLIKIEPSRQPLMYARPPNTHKWPDPNKVLEYACGSAEAARKNLDKSSAEDVREYSPPTGMAGIVGSVVRAVDGGLKKLKVRLPRSPPKKVRRGCRCGNAAVTPGKLTCCGQRCPCYVDNKACFECKCKGCRNPHLPNGKKLLQGLNAVIDMKTNKKVQLASVSDEFSLDQDIGVERAGQMGKLVPYTGPYPPPSMSPLPVIQVHEIKTKRPCPSPGQNSNEMPKEDAKYGC